MLLRTEYFKFLFLPVLGLSLLTGCQSNNKKINTSSDQKKLNEKLVRVNKIYSQSEDEQIEDYIARHEYKMTATPTGLRYMVYKTNSGLQPKTGSKAEINYKVWQLDGKLCYDSDSLGTVDFEIGKSDLPEGLQQGIQYMHEGEKAIFVMPSHLAYGLTGDGGQINPNAALVMDVELLKVKK